MCARNALPRELKQQLQYKVVETWEYDDEDCVHVFGHEVSSDVQRPETHSCIGDGMLIESPIARSSIEQRKNVDSTLGSSQIGWFLSECIGFGN